MSRYRCAKGCTRIGIGGRRVPQVHYSKKECPYEPEYAGPKTASTESSAPPQAAPPAAVEAEPSSKPSPAPPPKKGLLSFGSRPATVTSRAATTAPTVEAEWEVDEDHALSWWEMVDNIVLRGIHMLDGLLQVKPYEGGVLVHNSADEELLKKRFSRRIVTRITRWLGAKNQEEAHGIIDSGGILLLLSGMFFAVGAHFLEAWKTSPVLAKRRKEKEEKDKARKKVQENAPAALAQAQPVGATA